MGAHPLVEMLEVNELESLADEVLDGVRQGKCDGLPYKERSANERGSHPGRLSQRGT